MVAPGRPASRPFARVLNPERPPTGDELLADLIAFHTERPAITEATLGECRTQDGQTGYDLLVEVVPPGARTVLDLGCGNGPLARRLLALPTLTQVVALDACEAELALVRRGVDDARLVTRHEPAQQLALPDRCLDAALSHHAFYLCQPLDPVIAQLARCLRPGAPFAFVTSSPEADRYEPFAALMTAMGEAVRPHNPHFAGWMEPRLRTVAGMRALFALGSGFSGELQIDPFVVLVTGSAEQIADRMLAFFYTASLLPAEARVQLRARWVERLAASPGPLEFPSARVTVWAAG